MENNRFRCDAIIEANREEMVGFLQALVRINSVEGEAKPGAPFGEGPALALDTALEKAAEMGFRTKNLDHYIGYAEYGPEEGEAVGIIVHLDVVPEGKGWDTEPFGAVIQGGRMYGRGTMDDKGPAVAAMYALLAVKQSGAPLKRKVRLIFGCDEESGWKDIDHYLETEEMPEIGFSPDGEYPIINGEKSIAHIQLQTRWEKPWEGDGILQFQSGERPNIVPGHASCRVQLQGEPRQMEASGVAAHGSTPQEGDNAITRLMAEVDALQLGGEGAAFLKALVQIIGRDVTGACLGLDEKLAGEVTVNLGMMDIEKTSARAVLDIRYPLALSKEELLRLLEERFRPYGISLALLEDTPGHEVPETEEVVQALKGVYQEATGQEAKCLTIGGGTFARCMKKGVAFGPVLPQEATLAHTANEYYDLNQMMVDAKMMAEAILRLAGA